MTARHLDRRPITADEAARILARHAAGASLGDLVETFDRDRAVIRRFLARRLAVERAARHVQRATEARGALGRKRGSTRPAHVTALPFTRAWFNQCGRAFAEALTREHGHGARDVLPHGHDREE